MRELVFEARIASGVDAGIAGLKVVVDRDSICVVAVDTGCLEPQSLDIGKAPGASQDCVDDAVTDRDAAR